MAEIKWCSPRTQHPVKCFTASCPHQRARGEEWSQAVFASLHLDRSTQGVRQEDARVWNAGTFGRRQQWQISMVIGRVGANEWSGKREAFAWEHMRRGEDCDVSQSRPDVIRTEDGGGAVITIWVKSLFPSSKWAATGCLPGGYCLVPHRKRQLRLGMTAKAKP